MAVSEEAATDGNMSEPVDIQAGSVEATDTPPQDTDLSQTLFTTHPDGVILIVDGKIALVNERFAEMSAYSTEEVVGMAPSEFVSEEERRRADERVEALLTGGHDPPGEYSLLRKDGRFLPVHAHPKPIQHADKPAILTVVRDISERRLAEETLRTSEQRYRTLYELASDAFLNVLPDGEIIDANIAAANLLGYTVDELKRLTGADDIIAPEVFEETEQAWRAQLEERGQFLVDTLWVRKDGSRVPVAVSGKPLMVGDQQQLQLIGRDVSKQSLAERDRHALEEERYHRLLEEAPDGIMIVNFAGVIETVNARIEELFGYDRNELIGKPIEMLVPERFRKEHPAHRLAYTSSPRARVMGPELELFGLRKDGSEFPADLNLNAMLAGLGISVIVTVRDMTAYVESERALHESEATNRALLAAMPDMIFRMSRDGTYIGFVPGAEATPHLPPSEFLGRNVREMLPNMADEILQAVEQALESQHTQTLSFDDAFDEGVRSLELRINVCGEDEVLVIARDVTERTEAEKTLRESEARFSTAFHDNPVPVAISRMRDGKLIDLNDAFLSLTGHRRSETTGRTTTELGLMVDPAKRDRLAEAVSERGTVRDVPGRIKTRTGKVLNVLATTTQIELEGEPCVLATFVDITERKRLEEELQEIRDDLESKIERQMERANSYKLTFREFTVLHLVAAGKTDKEIAAELIISIYTVHRHVSKILAKMDSPSRTEAGTRALREGLLD